MNSDLGQRFWAAILSSDSRQRVSAEIGDSNLGDELVSAIPLRESIHFIEDESKVQGILIRSVNFWPLLSHEELVQGVQILWQASLSSHPLCALQVLERQEYFEGMREFTVKNLEIEGGIVGMTREGASQYIIDLVGVRRYKLALVHQIDLG